MTNLSEDTREDDLQELFRPFGGISRIYLAKDKVTGASKVRNASGAELSGGIKADWQARFDVLVVDCFVIVKEEDCSRL